VESGRTVLQVATTGLSAVIGPDGEIRERSGALYTPAILDATVPLRTGQTIATRVGAVPEYVLAGLAVAAILASLTPYLRGQLQRRRSLQSGTAPSADSDHEKVTT
jgi:apolipoprotein N-acyltransferase